jgi:hypothetical protein
LNIGSIVCSCVLTQKGTTLKAIVVNLLKLSNRNSYRQSLFFVSDLVDLQIVGRYSSVCIATRYRLDGPGIESRWGRHFQHPSRQARGPPSLLYNGYRVSFPGVKRPGHGVDHPTPSSARVKERVELYLYSPSGPSWPVLGKTLPLPYTYENSYTNVHILQIFISKHNLTVLKYAALLSLLHARLSLRRCNFNIVDGTALISTRQHPEARPACSVPLRLSNLFKSWHTRHKEMLIAFLSLFTGAGKQAKGQGSKRKGREACERPQKLAARVHSVTQTA